MARVTVEDCIQHISNRFELVALAVQRGKQIANGSPITVERDNDKDAVVSLREIAGTTVNLEALKEELVRDHRRFREQDDSTGNREQNILAAPIVEQPEELEIAQAIAAEASLTVPKPASKKAPDMSGLSFEEENLDVED